MNPAANTTTSGGLSAAVVVIVNWLCTTFGVPPMPTDVSTAWGVLFTALFGYYFHLRSQNPGTGLFLTARKPTAPAAPVPAPQA